MHSNAMLATDMVINIQQLITLLKYFSTKFSDRFSSLLKNLCTKF